MGQTICGDGDEMFHMQMVFFEPSAVCCAEYCVCWSNVDNMLVKLSILVSVFVGGCVDYFVWID